MQSAAAAESEKAESEKVESEKAESEQAAAEDEQTIPQEERISTAESMQKSVVFSENFLEMNTHEKEEDWLNPAQREALESLRKMLTSESMFSDEQRRALQALREAMFGELYGEKSPRGDEQDGTSAVEKDGYSEGEKSFSKDKQAQIEEDTRSLLVYSLLCHLDHESMVMGIDPSSLLRT